jgi:futalosine hydrolase
MRILIVAATELEVTPIRRGLGDAAARPGGVQYHTFAGHDVEVLTTGIGMVATAAAVSRALSMMHYDLALNAGVCGAFDPGLELGSVVHVVTDRLAELGAEDGDTFLTPDELPLVCVTEMAALPPENPTLARLPAVSGITVNTIHGNERSIAAVKARFHPQVESMEGAAFMYTCMLTGAMPFAEIRAVSNVVETRNRAAWKLREAADNLGATMLAILETL